MEPWLAAMFAADAAEARGDPVGALHVMNRLPDGPDGQPFWRPWRVERTLQLAMFGPTLPRWVTSRWILEQAHCAMHEGRRDIVRRAEAVAVELRGGPSELEDVDEIDARCQIMDRDWVYRQLVLFDYGGLRHFLRHQAAPDLVAGADRIHQWAESPMGGYEVVEHRAALTTWLDLATDQLISGPNIGSAVNLDVGRRVIGRLVPTDEGHVFETKPLPVPKDLARAVAERPQDWVDLVREDKAAHEGRGIITDGDHVECFVSDVPPLLWAVALLKVSAKPHPDPADPRIDDAIARMVLDAAAVALDTMSDSKPPNNIDIWPCLGAAMITSYVASALARSVQRGDVPVLSQLAGRLPEPASTICLQLAEAALDAA